MLKIVRFATFIALLFLCETAKAFIDGYPVFVPDANVSGLYYWTGSLTPEEDIGSEESMAILVLPSEMPSFDGYYNYQLETIEEYIVDESSPYLTSIDGVVFRKDMTELLAYPRNKQETEYTVPAGVIGIAANAFAGNQFLESVIFPDSLKWIDESAFSECSSLKSINWNHGLLCIKDRAFEYCSNLTELNCPEELKCIGFRAFYMSNLSRVTLNEQLMCVMGEAFYTHYFDKTEVVLPASVIYFDRTVFSPDEEITIISSKESYHLCPFDGVTQIRIQ